MAELLSGHGLIKLGSGCDRGQPVPHTRCYNACCMLPASAHCTHAYGSAHHNASKIGGLEGNCGMTLLMLLAMYVYRHMHAWMPHHVFE
jgi:hypothetical protein